MNFNLFSDTTDNVAFNFPTSYQQIIERINHINPIQYSKTRNFLNGAVTYLSPYISRGIISVKQVTDAVLQKGYKPNQIEKFLQELAWREYYQRVWQHIGDDIWKDIKQPQPDVLHHQMIETVEHAATGIDVIDEHIKNYTAVVTCTIMYACTQLPWFAILQKHIGCNPLNGCITIYLTETLPAITAAGNGWLRHLLQKNIISTRKM